QRARREAAEDRVRQAVADVAHALQHDVDADEAAQRARHRRDDQAVAEELEVERAQQLVDHGAPPCAWSCVCPWAWPCTCVCPWPPAVAWRCSKWSTTTGIPPCSRTCMLAP